MQTSLRSQLPRLWILAALSVACTGDGAAQEGSGPAATLPPPTDTAGTDARHGQCVASGPADPLRQEAERARGLRILISLSECRLWLMHGGITLHHAPVGIGKGTTLRHDGRSWTFATPRGRRRVIAKESNPVWIPPEWHYVELAQQRGFELARLRRGADTLLGGGGRLRIRGDSILLLDPQGRETALPADEEIVIGDTLFVPPFGTANRRIRGELGQYKLDLGGGYLLHGTRDQGSVGGASTHGCLRVRDEDLELLFQGVPVGTPVYIF